jgi:hypothetical protein
VGTLNQYTQKKVLDHILKTSSYSPPAGAALALGLSTADPGEDGAGWTNPTYTGYARKNITFGAAGSRVIAQNAVVTFDPCSGGTSTVTHWGLWDQIAAGGNLLAYGALSASKVIVTGNTPSVASGQVTVTFSAGGVFTVIANYILDWLFRAQALAQPTNVKIALSTTIPTDGGPNITEPSGNNYAQVTLNTWNAATIATPSLADNNGDIAFGAPSGSWGTIVYGVVYKDTEPFVYVDVTDQLVGVGDTVKFLSGALDITLT